MADPSGTAWLATWLWLLLSHVLGDGLLNNRRIALAKRQHGYLGQAASIALHAGIHATCAALLGIPGGYNPWLAWPLVLAQHFAVDFVRCTWERAVFGPGTIYLGKRAAIALLRTPASQRTEEERRLLRIFLASLVADQGSHALALAAIALVV